MTQDDTKLAGFASTKADSCKALIIFQDSDTSRKTVVLPVLARDSLTLVIPLKIPCNTGSDRI